MGIERERKFVLNTRDLEKAVADEIGELYLQGWPARDPESWFVARYRIVNEKSAYFTLKGPPDKSGEAFEWNAEMPLDDAMQLDELCPNKIKKTRYKISRYEVDVFHDEPNKDLVLVELELFEREDPKMIDRPEWLHGAEDVTGDPRFYNSELARVGYRLFTNPNLEETWNHLKKTEQHDITAEVQEKWGGLREEHPHLRADITHQLELYTLADQLRTEN